MKKNLKYFLKGVLSEKKLQIVPSSFDIVGDIMIFSEFPKELFKNEKLIGKIILENYKNIKSVYKKTKHYSGKFRTPKLKWIAGEKRKETVHKENNIVLKLDAEKVYFSPRTSNERQRIAGIVRPMEKVLVMFSGCGPFPLVIAKNSKCKVVHGIEANPVAHKYASWNLEKNKLWDKVVLHKGDVRKIIPKLKEKFDRVIMPLPKNAEKFLDVAFRAAKSDAKFHLYTFHDEHKLDTAPDIVRQICEAKKKKCGVFDVVKCGHYSPGYFRICIDFQLA